MKLTASGMVGLVQQGLPVPILAVSANLQPRQFLS